MNIENFEMTDEEKIAFADATMYQANELVNYILGDRNEPDDPVTVMKRHIKFFDADWMGLIDFDLDMNRWSTKCFYNADTESTTETLIQDAENTAQALRWVKAIKERTPIIIENIEDIKDEAPEEYEMYKRLKVHSVLGIPYMNCGTGLLVVRNPKQFKTNYQALAIMSYIITREMIMKQRRSQMGRQLEADEPSSEKEIYIKMLGELEIVSKNLRLTKTDLTDPIRFIICFLTNNKGKSFSLDYLANIYRCDTESLKNYIYRFRKKWKTLRNYEEDSIEYLIATIDNKEYKLNPQLNVHTDVEDSMELARIIEETGDVKTKIELLEKFSHLYRGEFLSGEVTACPYLANLRFQYRAIYLEKMKELLGLLYSQAEYSTLIKYAGRIINICPKATDFHSYRIKALDKLGQIDTAREAYESALSVLDDKEKVLLKEAVRPIFDQACD